MLSLITLWHEGTFKLSIRSGLYGSNAVIIVSVALHYVHVYSEKNKTS